MSSPPGSDYVFPTRGARSVCGTLNNPSDEEIQVAMDHPLPKYICGAIEYAPTTGTKHWQFYMAFENCVRLSTLNKIMPRAHFRACRGNADENINYVKKCREIDIANGVDNASNLATFQERGEPPATAKRLLGMHYAISTLREMLEDERQDVDPEEVLYFLDQIQNDAYDILHDLSDDYCMCSEDDLMD